MDGLSRKVLSDKTTCKHKYERETQNRDCQVDGTGNADTLRGDGHRRPYSREITIVRGCPVQNRLPGKKRGVIKDGSRYKALAGV